MGNLVKKNLIVGSKDKFIEFISSSVDEEALCEQLSDRFDLEIDTANFKDGDLVASGDKVAFQLEYEVRATVSVVIDSEGNYAYEQPVARSARPKRPTSDGESELEEVVLDQVWEQAVTRRPPK